MLKFLSDNLVTVIIVAAAVIAAIILARFGYKKEAKSILLYLVASAEAQWGADTGEIKFSSVITALYEKLPPFARVFLSEKSASSLIEEAVTKLKKYLTTENNG